MNANRFCAAVLALVISCGAINTMSYYSPEVNLIATAEQNHTEVVENGVIYYVYDEYAEVGRQKADEIKGNIVISEKVGGMPVTAIGLGAFANCANLRSINIPDSVKNIKSASFAKCINLNTITIPDSVISIEQSAFWMCDKLNSITILNKECEIWDDASTISNCPSHVGDWDTGTINDNFTGTIYGYKGSTAEAYARRYDYKFEALKDVPKITSTVTTVTTVTTITSTETTTFTLPVPVGNVSFGDSNGDGAINAVDATYILQLYVAMAVKKIEMVKLDTVTKQGILYSDVNRDGAVNAVDASYVLSYYAYFSTNSLESKLTFEEFMKHH
ncbi:leucine-rich repeat protein [Ruminococcus flavefaciens]|uniref:leucine-rich repeat protein n=1 Tax=Ruminococcus flavefaciens TaxID=1265 RepID=UPI0026F000B6|nr:leucine-rich repeat protein [Ruminococcus flavefaciens]